MAFLLFIRFTHWLKTVAFSPQCHSLSANNTSHRNMQTHTHTHRHTPHSLIHRGTSATSGLLLSPAECVSQLKWPVQNKTQIEYRVAFSYFPTFIPTFCFCIKSWPIVNQLDSQIRLILKKIRLLIDIVSRSFEISPVQWASSFLCWLTIASGSQNKSLQLRCFLSGHNVFLNLIMGPGGLDRTGG